MAQKTVNVSQPNSNQNVFKYLAKNVRLILLQNDQVKMWCQ